MRANGETLKMCVFQQIWKIFDDWARKVIMLIGQCFNKFVRRRNVQSYAICANVGDCSIVRRKKKEFQHNANEFGINALLLPAQRTQFCRNECTYVYRFSIKKNSMNALLEVLLCMHISVSIEQQRSPFRSVESESWRRWIFIMICNKRNGNFFLYKQKKT